MNKNPYEEGTPEYEAFEAGIALERKRMMKVIEVYHKRFGKGSIEESESTMQIKHIYEFVNASRTTK
jgi:hypothetical protein